MTGAILRYRSLPKPVSLRSYFDPDIQSAQVTPSLLSKVNTALQMLLLAISLGAPLLELPADWLPLCVMQWTVAGTTLFSGLSYLVHHRQAFRFIK